MNKTEFLTLKKDQRYICHKNIKLIKCIKGTFWITYRYGKDIILNSGEKFYTLNKKSIIIQVLKPGEIYLEKKVKYSIFNIFSNKYKFQQVS